MAEGQPRITNAGTRAAAVYGLMIGALVLLYLWIRSYGDTLGAPGPVGSNVFGSAISRANQGDLLHLLLALVVVIATARAMGWIFRSAKQPQVVGEILAGIVLGPSLLGRLAPGAEGYIFPAAVGPFLNVIAQVGVILYMFLVGLELDPALLRKRGHATVAISHASIVLPFLLGAAIALYLYPRLSTSDVPFTCFSLFLGVSMSVTAFPVLARILTDRGIHKTRMGAIALTCAAVDDVTAWCMLAFVVSVARAEAAGAVATIAMALGFIVLMIVVVRPAMARLSLLYGNRGRLTQGVMASVFIALLISSSATELIGIHAVFGAFALGAVIPHDSGMAREMTDRLEDIVIVLLLPAFFAYTGLRTQIGLVNGSEQWMMCAMIVAVASAGKFGGSAIAARITGLNWRDSTALGVLMNTRGLMELIVLNIGLEMNVISPTLFAMLVIMALVTTFATTPILHLITRRQGAELEPLPELGTFSPEPAVAPQAPSRVAPFPAPHPAPHTQSAADAAAAASDAGRDRAQRDPGAGVESGRRRRSDRTRAGGDAARCATAARARSREDSVGRSAIGTARGRPACAAPLSRAVGGAGPRARARQHHHAAGSLDDQPRGRHPGVRERAANRMAADGSASRSLRIGHHGRRGPRNSRQSSRVAGSRRSRDSRRRASAGPRVCGGRSRDARTRGARPRFASGDA